MLLERAQFTRKSRRVVSQSSSKPVGEPHTHYGTIVVPSHDVVIVRRGLDYGRQGFNRWDLTREVLKAIQPTSEDR